MARLTPFLSLLAAALPLVSAHGYVDKAIIAGTEYPTYQPYYDPYVSPKRSLIWRPIQGNGPVENLSLIDVQCGGYTAGGYPGSAPAALHATAPAGSEVALTWTKWPDSHKGPLITYMARCPGSCADWQPGTAKVWFKIHEIGKNPDGTWWIQRLETEPVPAYKFTIPATLAPGNYIIRHEILALHGAWAYPGIQDYPSCFQVTVTGSGTAVPPASALVSFPGEYVASHPGITYDMYSNPLGPYPIPGPPVWNGQGGGSVPPPPATTSSARPTSSTTLVRVTSTSSVAPPPVTTTAAPPPTGPAVGKYGQCGGIGYNGSTTCVAGSTCTKQNDYYHQCL